MATQSFFQDMVLTTNEELERLEEAFDKAERRGPIDTSAAHELCTDPEKIDKLLRSVKISD